MKKLFKMIIKSACILLMIFIIPSFAYDNKKGLEGDQLQQ
jgi:hypothetical protein